MSPVSVWYTHISGIFIKPGRLECSARLKCKVNNMNGNYISIQPKYEVYKIKMLEICLISIQPVCLECED